MVLFWREMMNNMKKKFLSTLLVVVMTFSFLGTSSQVRASAYEKESSNATKVTGEQNNNYDGDGSKLQLTEDGHALGAKEMTPEGQAWRDENVKEVKSAELNPLGKERAEEKTFKGLAPNLTIDKVDLNEETSNVDSNVTLPEQVDNSELDAFPGIGDQKSLPACTSFAGIYYTYTHAVNLMEKRNGKDDANKFSPTWTYNQINNGQKMGALVEDNFAVVQSVGAASLKDVPYVGSPTPKYNYLAWEKDASIWKKAQRYGIKEIKSTKLEHISSPTDSNLNVVKTELANGNLLNYSTNYLGVNFAKVKDDLSTSKDDQYVGQRVCKYHLKGFTDGHELTIVGYNDDIWTDINGNGSVDQGEKGAFKIANSWGEEWGNKGFFWVAYDAFNEVSEVPNCPLSQERRESHCKDNPTWIVPEVKSEDPSLYAEFTLNTSDRSACKVTLTAVDKSTGAKSSFTPYQFSGGKGGRYGFDGDTDLVDGSFAIDLTKVVKDITPDKLKSYKWFLEVQAYSSEVKIKNYKIVDEKNKNTYSANITSPISIKSSSGKVAIFQDYEDLKIKEIKTDKAMPRIVGDAIKVSTEVIGGSNSKLYTYTIKPDAPGAAKEVIAENTKESSVTWIPKVTGDNWIQVDVTDTVTGEKATLSKYYKINESLNMDDVYVYDQSTQPINKKVTFRANVDGGDGQVTYSCKVLSPENYTVVENSASNCIDWVPRKVGEYNIEVAAKDELGNIVTKNVKFVATDSIGEVTTPSNVKLCPVDSKTANMVWDPSKTTATNGSIIEYVIYRDGKYLTTTCNETYQIALDNELHKYTVMARATGDLYSEMSSEITVGRLGLKFKEITTDKAFPRIIGDSIKITADVEGGSNSRSYTYKIMTSDGAVKEQIKENTPESTVTWTPKEAGGCVIKVDVKDTITGETATLTKYYIINSKVNIDDLKTSGEGSGPVGKKVSIETLASGGAGYQRELKYSYKAVGPDEYTIIYKTSDNKITWIPRKAGEYWIEVVVTDKEGNIIRNAIKYTVTETISEVSTPKLDIDQTYLEDGIKWCWNPSTTTKGTIAGYEIYKDGVLYKTITDTNIIVPIEKEEHEYKLMAFNTEGVYSEMSNFLMTYTLE
jgi:hypothetical protein